MWWALLCCSCTVNCTVKLLLMQTAAESSLLVSLSSPPACRVCWTWSPVSTVSSRSLSITTGSSSKPLLGTLSTSLTWTLAHLSISHFSSMTNWRKALKGWAFTWTCSRATDTGTSLWIWHWSKTCFSFMINIKAVSQEVIRSYVNVWLMFM